ncbi:MAG: hypothetical protein M3P06_24250 [Acidobacteriota bacterium]|nr:hypothetical protein [Acidobacteriota bacterium]
MEQKFEGVNVPLAQGDVQEYVTAFKASSDRARYALFVVIITTVLVAIANYNVQEWGWPSRRLATWYQFAPKTDPTTPKTAPATVKTFPFFRGDADQLQTAREEYLKQFTARAVFAASPIPGVSIDVNDIGLVGGVALCLLMLVQALCVMREHENLFLALYKVRSLHDEEEARRKHGDSRANLLYHALAMSQVLSSPPTLARWEDRSMLSHLYLVFYIPAVAYAWVVVGNFGTMEHGAAYGVEVVALLVLQCTMALMLLLLATICLLNSKAMAERWQRAFFRINPRLRRLAQPNEWQWLKIANWLRKPSDPAHELSLKAIACIVDSLDTAEGRFMTSVDVKLPRRTIGDKLDGKELHAAVEDLKGVGRAHAKQWCDANRATFVRLETFKPTVNAVTKDSWELAGTWMFSYDQM